MYNEIQTKNILINDVDITYYCAGQEGGDAVMLLHGAGVDSATLSWREVITLLAVKYRVIAPDLPGYGKSGRIDGEYSLKFYTDIVKKLIEALSDKPVILAGLSLGGGITLNMALNYPSLLKAIIPVDAWGLFEKLPYHRLTYYFTHSKINDNAYAWTNKQSLIKWSLKYNLFGDKNKISDALSDEISKAMREPDAGWPFISFQRSEITPKGLNTNLFARLDEINLPTLLIHGSKDKAVPFKDAIAASKIIPDCELYVMQGCRHWPQKERPEEFAEAVISYLDKKFGNP